MSGKLRLKLIVHCFQFAAEAKRRHLSPCCFSSDDYQMIYPIYYPILLSGFIIRFYYPVYYPIMPGDAFADAAVTWDHSAL